MLKENYHTKKVANRLNEKSFYFYLFHVSSTLPRLDSQACHIGTAISYGRGLETLEMTTM